MPGQLKHGAIDEKYITVRTHKNGKPVQLPVHPEIRESLAKMRNELYTRSGPVKEIRNHALGIWQRTFRRLGMLAGVHIHTHRWRRTFATRLLSKGVPVSEVAAILGNSPRIIEKHYS